MPRRRKWLPSDGGNTAPDREEAWKSWNRELTKSIRTLNRLHREGYVIEIIRKWDQSRRSQYFAKVEQLANAWLALAEEGKAWLAFLEEGKSQ